MLEFGHEHAADVCLDWTSSVVASSHVRQASEQIGRNTLRHLTGLGWRAARYQVSSGSGISRPSSPQLKSLLNYSAVRYGAESILLELREPTGREYERRGELAESCSIAAAQDALQHLIRIHNPQLRSCKESSERPSRVPIKAKAFVDSERPHLWVRDVKSGEASCVPFSGAFRSGWQASMYEDSPLAYGIPKSWHSTIQWLEGHGCYFLPACEVPRGVLERATIGRVVASRNRLGLPRSISACWLKVEEESDPSKLGPERRWLPVTQANERLLTALLEPTSSYSAVHDGLIPWNPVLEDDAKTMSYPILRLVSPKK